MVRTALRTTLPMALLAAVLIVLALATGDHASAQLDPTGTWNISLSGDVTASCTAAFTLQGSAVSSDWECGSFGVGTLAGPFHKTGTGSTFNITGTIQQGTFSISFAADGSIAADGSSMSGTWYGMFDILTGYGTFEGQSKPSGAATPTAPVPPPQPTSTVTPTATDTPVPASTAAPTATNTSVPTSTATLTAMHTPVPTSSATPTPAGVGGDANCDHMVNSIDAAFELQYIAALIHSLACQGNADVNGDGMVNAIDVALTLQYVAGLLSHLPV